MAEKQNQSATSRRVCELLSYERLLDEEADSSHETEDGQAQRIGGATGGIDEVDLQVTPLHNAIEVTTSAQCNMSSEVDRVASFKNWPDKSAMNPTTLAKAGFFYVGPDDMVKCFSCYGKIKDWDFGDSAIGEHKRFFPKCKFAQEKHLQNLLSSKEKESTAEGKLTKREDLYNSKKDTSVFDNIPDKLKSEYRRLLTFQNWPRSNIMQPRTLAKAGFYYTQTRDVVKCFACNGEISNWKVMDVPMTQHTMLFPECPFVQGEDVANEKLTTTDVMNAQHAVVYREPSTKLPPIQKNESENKSQVSQMAEVTDQWSSIPRRRPLTRAQPPQCKNEAERLKRFNYWPSSAPEAPFPARFTDEPRDNKVELMSKATTTANLKRKFLKDDAKAGTKTLSVDGTISKRKLEGDEPRDNEVELMSKATTTANLKRKFLKDDAQAKAGTKTLSVDGTISKRKLEDESLLPLSVIKKLAKERNYLKCKICLKKDVNILLIPCQHLAVCTQCERVIQFCPICKMLIKTCIKVYWC